MCARSCGPVEMERFQRLDAVAVPFAAPDIDTDQIIPARFMQKLRSDGFGQYLFHDLRRNGDGTKRSGFILDEPAYRGARIAVAERNFGCGSSREQAVYALYDHGMRAIIAPSFGDIFFTNCFQNGILPVVLPAALVSALLEQLRRQPAAHVIVDLAAQIVIGPDGTRSGFAVDPFRKRLLLGGIDELDLTLGHGDRIAEFEKTHNIW
jgi:3-isopropylmalate/(R)-2-methylmalate dehydratase small subunit